jgi:hypothetical protein
MTDRGILKHTVYAKRYMIVVGTLGTGFEFFGPFDDIPATDRWTRDNMHVGASVRVEKFNLVRSE